MFEVKKSGKGNYDDFWAYGTLKYKGLEITDIFTTNVQLEIGKNYLPKEIYLKRNKKGKMCFKIIVSTEN